LLLYVHLKACFIYFIMGQAKVWQPVLDFVYWNEWEDGTVRVWNEALPVMQKYWISLYIAVSMLKGNDMAARTNMEIGIFTCVFLFDLIVAANVFGTVANLVQISNRRINHFQNQIDIANTAMANMKVPMEMY
jgi:hypothetical protein